jgi:hypothetical protein
MFERKALYGCYIGEGDRRHRTRILLPAWVSFMVTIGFHSLYVIAHNQFHSLWPPETYGVPIASAQRTLKLVCRTETGFLSVVMKGSGLSHLVPLNGQTTVSFETVFNICPLPRTPITAMFFSFFALSNFLAFLHVLPIMWQLPYPEQVTLKCEAQCEPKLVKPLILTREERY